MSLDKKGFAEVIDSAIIECKNISSYNKNLVLNENVSSDSVEYKYNKCIEKLTLSKVKRLYSILSVPAYLRIMSMPDKELREYKEDRINELGSNINRLMLALEVSRNDSEKAIVKKKIEVLVEEQSRLKEMTCEIVRKYVIDKLDLNTSNSDVSFDGKDETIVLQSIIKDKETLSKFLNMIDDYRKIEREIKGIRAEQIIIYNDLFNGNIKDDVSLDELFSEESLSKLQSRIAEKVNDINEAEIRIKQDFSNKTKNAFYKLNSISYKTSNKLPYEKGILDCFEHIVPSRTLELANLQNEEWVRLNKKVFKTSGVNSTLSVLCMEIDETKELIISYIKDWYKNAYYNNSLFSPVSSRASGKFEYSLGAKSCLDEFINLGVWPEEKEVNSLKLCLKLNKVEAEKCIIYAEQIKEKLTRLFNVSLDSKKKELEDLNERITSKFGNWKNDVILSIVNELK